MAETAQRDGQSADMFEPGQLVQGRYDVVRLVGKGGMGEVYEARDLRHDRRVALKTILPRLLGSEKILARFWREIELASRIKHRNVLETYDVFEIAPPDGGEAGAGVPCMVSEFLDGETLADRLERSGPLDPDEALPLARQIAAGLDASHRADVVHRDLKPDNVFLVPDGASMRVVLTDFGVARSAVATPHSSTSSDSLTATNVILGTPSYLAPEQLELESATPATDIYTLGLVMFEMITGHLPFESDSPLQMVFKRVKEDSPSPRIYRPELSPTWERTILRCLDREPTKRFPNAGEVAQALGGAPLTATGEPAAPSTVEGRRWLLPLVILMVILLALVIALALAV